MPFEIIVNDFYEKWFALKNGEITALFVLIWFFWGAFKAMVITYHDQNGKHYEESPVYRIKLCLLVPFAPIMDLRLPRPFFPQRLSR